MRWAAVTVPVIPPKSCWHQTKTEHYNIRPPQWTPDTEPWLKKERLGHLFVLNPNTMRTGELTATFYSPVVIFHSNKSAGVFNRPHSPWTPHPHPLKSVFRVDLTRFVPTVSHRMTQSVAPADAEHNCLSYFPKLQNNWVICDCRADLNTVLLHRLTRLKLE